MKGKNDYQLYREPVPSGYSLNEIISRSLLLAAGGDDGYGKQDPAEGGFIYNFTDNRYPPVTEKDGGKIGIYCDPSFDCENINQPALEPDVLSRISRPDEWLPPFLKDVFTFIPVRIQRLTAEDAGAIVRRYGVYGTKEPAEGDYYIEIEITFSEAQRRAARLTADQERLISLIKTEFPKSAYSYKWGNYGESSGYVFTFYDGAFSAEKAPERFRAALRQDKSLWDAWEVWDPARCGKTGAVGKINYVNFRVVHH